MKSFLRNATLSRHAQTRSLSLHEYRSKELMRRYSVDHQRGTVIRSVGELEAAFKKVPTELKVIKAQVLAGGRGKGEFTNGFKGGVKLTKDLEKGKEIAKQMLGGRLKTKQTRGGYEGEGLPVNELFVAECLDFVKKPDGSPQEYYFALCLEGRATGAVMVGSAEGGVDIEEVPHEKLVIQDIPFKTGLTQDSARAFAKKMGFTGDYVNKAADVMVNLYSLMKKHDAVQVEINPLVPTPDGRVVCIDAKMNFDDNADFRQEEVFGWADPSQEDAKEVEAQKSKLSYVALDGNIACLVNGAGLAMATMDIIKLYGGAPANFLDVGGSATKETVANAFRIICKDPNVKGILVNIFGGIMKCDTIAEGIIAASKEVTINVPLVVRLAGTNVEKGTKLIQNSGLPIAAAADLDDAAAQVVKAVKKTS